MARFFPATALTSHTEYCNPLLTHSELLQMHYSRILVYSTQGFKTYMYIHSPSIQRSDGWLKCPHTRSLAPPILFFPLSSLWWASWDLFDHWLTGDWPDCIHNCGTGSYILHSCNHCRGNILSKSHLVCNGTFALSCALPSQTFIAHFFHWHQPQMLTEMALSVSSHS